MRAERESGMGRDKAALMEGSRGRGGTERGREEGATSEEGRLETGRGGRGKGKYEGEGEGVKGGSGGGAEVAKERRGARCNEDESLSEEAGEVGRPPRGAGVGIATEGANEESEAAACRAAAMEGAGDGKLYAALVRAKSEGGVNTGNGVETGSGGGRP